MSRYWIFHDRRLKGPLEPEGLKELEGFAADTRVCPEGGPETDWRPAREHAELSALFQKAAPAALSPAPLPMPKPAPDGGPLPSIPRFTALPPLEPTMPPAPLPMMPPPLPAAPAVDPARVEALERRVAELQRSLDDHKHLIDALRRGKMEADRRVEELSSAVVSAMDQVERLKNAPAPSAPEPVLPPAPAALPPAPAVEPPALPLPPPFSELEHAVEKPKETPVEDKTVMLSAAEPTQLKKETPPEDRTVVLPAPSAAAPGARKLKVLSADDDELMRQAIASTFKKAGHDVDTVADGTKALEMIAANFYDVVILDETMPSGSGFQVARAVARVDADSRPKVLIFTSQPVEHKLARDIFLMSGADDVLAKEAGMAGLLKKVCQLTGLPEPA